MQMSYSYTDQGPKGGPLMDLDSPPSPVGCKPLAINCKGDPPRVKKPFTPNIFAALASSFQVISSEDIREAACFIPGMTSGCL